MKNLIRIALISFAIATIFGCSGTSGDESAPKGPVPEIKPMDPGVVPPDQRGGTNVPGGGEGTK